MFDGAETEAINNVGEKCKNISKWLEDGTLVSELVGGKNGPEKSVRAIVGEQQHIVRACIFLFHAVCANTVYRVDADDNLVQRPFHDASFATNVLATSECVT